jgi:hypothetical protein
MKSSILRTLLTLSLSAAFAPFTQMAEGQSTLRDTVYATIPFDFTIGQKAFATGKYCVKHLSQDVLVIRNLDDHSSVVAMTLPGRPSRERGTTVLRFTRYGASYFLSEVSDDSHGWRLHQSAAEKELIAKNAANPPITLAVALSSK